MIDDPKTNITDDAGMSTKDFSRSANTAETRVRDE
jgi:hypothetical protein